MTDQSLPVSSQDAAEQEIIALRRRIAELEARETAHPMAVENSFLQAALDAMPAHVAVLDDTGTIVMVNAAWRQFAEENELPAAANYGLGVNYLTLCDTATGPFSEDAPLVAHGLREVIARRQDEFRHQYVCPSPTHQRWFTMQANALAGVTPSHTLVAHMDVSVRQKIQIALEESHHTLETMLSNLPGMAYSCENDFSWTVQFVSEGCLNLTGYSPDDLISNKVVAYFDLIHPDDRQMVWDAVQYGVAHDQPFQIIYRIMAKDGSLKWVWEQGRAIVQADGKTILEGLIIDFTAQQQAQIALQASDEKLRNLIHQTHDGIILGDNAGQIIEWNPAMERITGLAREEVLGRTLWEVQYNLIPEGRRSRITPEQLAQEMKEIATEKDILEFPTENAIQRTDGEIRMLQTSQFPIRIDSDRLLGAVVRDITEQRAAVNALHESEERWRSLVEYAPDMIFMIDREGRILFVNYTVAGFDVEETVGRTLYEFALPAYHETLRQAIARVFDLGQPANVELESPASSDTFGWYHARLGPIMRDGEVVAAILIAHDITDRRRRETELSASEGRYRNLFEEVPVALWEEDCSDVKAEIERLRAAGVTNLEQYLTERPQEITRLMAKVRILNVNRATMELTRARSKAEALESLTLIPPPEVLPLMRSQLVAIANGATSYSGEGVGLSSDGAAFPISLKWVALLGHEQSMNKIIVSIEDITVRRESEAERLRTAIEREKVTILADFVQNASHEFRTPLSVIFTGLELIERRAGLDEAWMRRLVAMKTQTQYLSELVELMLAMAQLDRTTELSGMLLDLNPIVRDVAGEAKRQASDQSIRLNLDLPEQLPRVYGDASALRRALLNIAKNAVQFSPSDGTVTLSIKQHEHEIAVSVSDQGIGIPPEHLPYVFDRFYRVDRARRARYAGLGLSISRKIVELHGGHITVTSTHGRGSTFTVWLPLHPIASTS